MKKYKNYIDNIDNLSEDKLAELIAGFSEEDRLYAERKARALTEKIFNKKIYIRGLIEFSNYCRNDCYYCGIRCSNRNIERFRLSFAQIMECCRKGYALGFRTFVLQSGEDPYFTDDKMVVIISAIRREFPDCAITVSIGEKSYESYKRFFDAGADRYLLRHETADKAHYCRLHPQNMSFEERMRCLRELKEIGYQTGCGIMVGSPGQTPETIAKDLLFMKEFSPEMVGIGPFLPQSNTPFKDEAPGSVRLTLFLLSLIRLLLPNVLLPSTTALGSAKWDVDDGIPDGGRKGASDDIPDSRIMGILAGANVHMPNLSPEENREKYLLYDNKAGLNDEADYVLEHLSRQLSQIGYSIDISRGDYEENK